MLILFKIQDKSKQDKCEFSKEKYLRDFSITIKIKFTRIISNEYFKILSTLS